MQNICIVYDLFKVNFNFGPPVCDEEPISSSTSMADTGGLVASGEGTAAGKPKAGPRLKPIPPGGGGLVTLAGPALLLAGVGTGIGGVALLNSAHLGHLRFVSTKRQCQDDFIKMLVVISFLM